MKKALYPCNNRKLQWLMISVIYLATKSLVNSKTTSWDSTLIYLKEEYEEKTTESSFNLIYSIDDKGDNKINKKTLERVIFNNLLIPSTTMINETLNSLADLDEVLVQERLKSLEKITNTLYLNLTQALNTLVALEIKNEHFIILFVSNPAYLMDKLHLFSSFGKTIFGLDFVRGNDTLVEIIEREVAFARFCIFDKDLFKQLQKNMDISTPIISMDWVKFDKLEKEYSFPHTLYTTSAQSSGIDSEQISPKNPPFDAVYPSENLTVSTFLNFSKSKTGGFCYSLNKTNLAWQKYGGYQYKYCNVSAFNSTEGPLYLVLGEMVIRSEGSREIAILLLVYFINVVTILVYLHGQRGGIKNIIQFRNLMTYFLVSTADGIEV